MALPAPYADGAHLALQVEACVRTMAHEVAVKIVAHATQAGMSGEREGTVRGQKRVDGARVRLEQVVAVWGQRAIEMNSACIGCDYRG